jgi:cell division septation protein DedD
MGRQVRGGLGLLDRLVLLVAWGTTCGLVYLLGLYVGREMPDRGPGLEERVVRLPVTSQPPPEGQRPKAESAVSFYDTLMAGERGGSRSGGEGRAAATEAGVAAGSRGPAAAPGATTTPAAARLAGAGPASPRPVARTSPAPAEPPRVAATGRTAPGAASGAAPAALGPPPAGAAHGGWTVQANPTRSREEAEGLLRQLRGRGYEASVVRVLRDGDTWYRVQVGHFASSAEATEVKQRLREREGVSHAFVASE